VLFPLNVVWSFAMYCCDLRTYITNISSPSIA